MAVHVVDHPLVRHKLGILRKESTSTSEFRMLAKEIARLLMYEATKQFKTEKRTIKGWAGPVEVESISGKMVTIVPILRAGLGLMDGVLDMVPGAKISVVGLYRNEETLEPVEYYVKLAKEIDHAHPLHHHAAGAVDALHMGQPPLFCQIPVYHSTQIPPLSILFPHFSTVACRKETLAFPPVIAYNKNNEQLNSMSSGRGVIPHWRYSPRPGLLAGPLTR